MNTQVQLYRPHVEQPRVVEINHLPAALLRLIRVWHQRARQRRQLMSLPPEMLKDIGVSRADAVREASKSFWTE